MQEKKQVRPFRYRVWDEKSGAYLPGSYRNRQIVQMTGADSSMLSTYARTGYLIGKRYRISICGERESWKDAWARDWDETRRKYLKKR